MGGKDEEKMVEAKAGREAAHVAVLSNLAQAQSAPAVSAGTNTVARDIMNVDKRTAIVRPLSVKRYTVHISNQNSASRECLSD